MRISAFIILFSLFSIAQGFTQNKLIEGLIIDDTDDSPIPEVNIQIKKYNISTITNADGKFQLKVPLQSAYQLEISHVSYINRSIEIRDNEIGAVEIRLKPDQMVLQQVDVKAKNNKLPTGNLQKMTPISANELATPFNEFNQLIGTLPGVVSNNELSSAYAVRGGNFDENLIYVNGIEIYRPLLVRAGQQEGLSFINPDLVGNIKFSAGGWEAKYGDKLSSNLLIDYKKTDKTEGNVNLGLLGASAYLSTKTTKKDNLLLGLRYKNAKYLFNTFDTDGEYLPRFLDFQGFYSYQFSSRTSIDVLATFAQNDYYVEPASRETDFGSFQQKLRFFVAYDGAESLSYRTFQGGTRLNHLFSDRFKTAIILSAFSTSEFEYINTEGFYRLCDVDRDFSSNTFDECISQRGAGSNFMYARNILDAYVLQAQIRNDWQFNKSQLFSFGMELKQQIVDDLLDEYEFRDSADFVQITRVVNQENQLQATFANAYVQHEWQINERQYLNSGLRLNYASNSSEFLLSPRLQYQLLLHPDESGQLSLSAGIYRQFPFYRELRDFQGQLRADIRAQNSIHFIANYTKNMSLWNRPFQMTGSGYYKYLYDIIPFDVDNIRLRYRPELEADGYSYGGDFRLSGEFIPGTESWFSLGVLSTKENVVGDGLGYIRRPTDQRVTASIFFQDYFINDPTLRVNLKLQVGSGLPFGPPNSVSSRNSLTGEWYRRMDVGFSKQFTLDRINFVESFWLGLDVLNVLGVSNTISYSWIEDFSGQNFAVPNSLSARFLNLKGIVKF
ncbi:carboxypeptidase-like regulatory domain-containing protein [Marivirga sp. S37H4]|uniref:Carboxypeptidase-like regulatory domain-containing protein n=1 Tax=Marivirga aurantiaca TaxID=2802615 RepID=A0A935C9V5_9BACT|nr:carboxypeptidase-like regulatory domain-containing protein [Marivirga aurantiaca]MBK6266396.1 carboxypeptidase-like regulatory domain-containing protein [Marivirga aurantiaca]